MKRVNVPIDIIIDIDTSKRHQGKLVSLRNEGEGLDIPSREFAERLTVEVEIFLSRELPATASVQVGLAVIAVEPSEFDTNKKMDALVKVVATNAAGALETFLKTKKSVSLDRIRLISFEGKRDQGRLRTRDRDENRIRPGRTAPDAAGSAESSTTNRLDESFLPPSERQAFQESLEADKEELRQLLEGLQVESDKLRAETDRLRLELARQESPELGELLSNLESRVRAAIRAQAAGDKEAEPSLVEMAYVGLLKVAKAIGGEGAKTARSPTLAPHPIEALAEFAIVQHDEVLGGPENLQKLLDKFAGFRFSSLKEMKRFADCLRDILDTFIPRRALQSKVGGRSGRIAAKDSQPGIAYFLLRHPDGNTSSAGTEAFHLPHYRIVNAGIDRRRRPS